MATVLDLVHTKATGVWAALMIATGLSWASGADVVGNHRTASMLVILVAFGKVRLIGLYFMEIRDAPLALRGAFEGYCLLVFATIAGMYLWA